MVIELENIQKQFNKTKEDYEKIVSLYEHIESQEKTIKRLRKILKKEIKTEYVKRDMLKKIIAAWIITVPVA